eukprot:4871290-Amphidinium_carterae.1
MDWWGTTYVKIDAAVPVGMQRNPELRLCLVGVRRWYHLEAYALVDSGASHVLLPLHKLGVKDRSEARDISVNLA